MLVYQRVPFVLLKCGMYGRSVGFSCLEVPTKAADEGDEHPPGFYGDTKPFHNSSDASGTFVIQVIMKSNIPGCFF